MAFMHCRYFRILANMRTHQGFIGFSVTCHARQETLQFVELKLVFRFSRLRLALVIKYMER